MAFDAFSCPSGARPSRVYVRYVERRPESSVPAANGHGTRPEPRREFRGHAPLQVGVQVNHGACPLGFQQRGKKTLLSLTLGPDRCLRSRNCPAGQFTLSLGVMWLSYEGSFQHTHTHIHIHIHIHIHSHLRTRTHMHTLAYKNTHADKHTNVQRSGSL